MNYVKFILILALVTAPVFSFHFKKAEAQFVGAAIVTGDPFTEAQWVATATATGISAGVNTAMSTWETVRKNWLDMLVYQAAQLMLNQITENIVTWIQNGFEGDPSFAVDPKRLFNDLADMVAGDLAAQIRGLAVCDFDVNFKLNLMNSLLLTQDQDSKFSRKVVCPFDTIDVSSCDSNGQNCKTISPAKRAEAFSQKFTNGLWGAYEASLRDGGNKFGVALTTKREVDRRTAESQKIQGDKLTQSGGFLDVLNLSSCEYPGEVQERLDSGEVNSGEKQALQRTWCKTGTPGSIVGSQLQKTTGIDMDRLGFADNLNKIATAFIQQLAKTAIEGIYTPGTVLASPPGLQGTIDALDACTGAGGEITEDQRAQVAALVTASPRVQNAGNTQDAAQTDFDNAADHLETLTTAAEVAEDAYTAAAAAASTALGNYNIANNNYNQCVAQGAVCLSASSGIQDPILGGFFTKNEILISELNEAKRNLYSPSGSGAFTSTTALPGQPTSKEAIKNAKFIAYQNAVAQIAPGSPAVSAVNSTRNTLERAIENYSNAAESAERSAMIQVTGLDVTVGQQNCASNITR